MSVTTRCRNVDSVASPIVAPPVLAGSLVSGIAAYLSVRFLVRYFETRTLTPFAIYCLIAGSACIVRFGFF